MDRSCFLLLLGAAPARVMQGRMEPLTRAEALALGVGCSFCHAPAERCQLLLVRSAPDLRVCDGCLQLCRDIIEERSSPPARRGQGPSLSDWRRAPAIVVLEDDGRRLGPLSPEEAQEIAAARGLAIVVVAPEADPPICRFVDPGLRAKGQRGRAKERVLLACSFCDRPQAEVHKLIAGPHGYICDRCVSEVALT